MIRLSPISQSEDWQETFHIVSDDDGVAFDLSSAVFTITVEDRRDNQRMTGSTTDGSITIPSTGVLIWLKRASAVRALEPNDYRLHCIATQGDDTRLLFRAEITVLDGVE